jgi:hypothetical protein
MGTSGEKLGNTSSLQTRLSQSHSSSQTCSSCTHHNSVEVVIDYEVQKIEKLKAIMVANIEYLLKQLIIQE